MISINEGLKYDREIWWYRRIFNARKIVKNKIRCKKCGDIIESVSVNDFKFCRCGAVAVDGGFDYLRRCGNLEDIEELSEVERG